MAKIKKAQVGRLIKKAISTVGRDIEKSAVKKAEGSANSRWKNLVESDFSTNEGAIKHGYNRIPRSVEKPTALESKIGKREKKIAKDNNAYDKAVWESYQRNGGKTRKSMKTGGTVKAKDGKWIQKAVKTMRTDKPCTGPKFGSKTCPPGSKRYNLAKTFKKMSKKK